MTHHDTVVAAVPRRTYQNAHAYHINSISVNSDGETFISSDDLRINLWNLNIQDQSFNIVDIKPANMEELTEVITAAEFHPQSCNWFMYASSKGTIKLADMRSSALCDQHAKRKFEVVYIIACTEGFCRIRAGGRSIFKVILLRDHFLNL
jgi:serine/threonine-protein phosphatase 2A regulatory subunit B